MLDVVNPVLSLVWVMLYSLKSVKCRCGSVRLLAAWVSLSKLGLGFVRAGSQAGLDSFYFWDMLSGCLVWSVLSSRLDCMVSPSTMPAPDARQLTALSGSLPGLVESTLCVCCLLFRDVEEGCVDFWASSPLCSQTSLFPPPLETPALCWGSPYLCCFGSCSGQEAGVEPSVMHTSGPVQ